MKLRRLALILSLVCSTFAFAHDSSSTKVEKPWGWYDTLGGGVNDGYQVKILHVFPGKKLSLQTHKFRSEHWVVTKGVARVRIGDEYFDRKVDEPSYVGVGVKHRIENPGTEPLEIIETQVGSYLGEDDIVRLEDDFGRK